VVDRHVHEQRVGQRGVARAPGPDVPPEVDRNRADRPKPAAGDQLGDGARGREEAVVLADHQHHAARLGGLDRAPRLGHARGERLFDQHVLAGRDRLQRHRDVGDQRHGHQHRLGLDRLERRLQRGEAELGRQAEGPPSCRQGGGIGIHPGNRFHLLHPR
jgi:hypothetical protein